jgi:transcription initiation factor TFIIIB Brf1 subunit/transcription initiation factor TFIIB
MKLFTTCPECGYKLGRSGDGTNTETSCPKCGALLNYEVMDGKVTVEILRHSAKSPAHLKK